jgi:hypothetical protein
MKQETVVIVDGDRLLHTPDVSAVQYTYKNGRKRSVPKDAWVLESEIADALSYTPMGEVVLDMSKASSTLKRAMSLVTIKGIPVHSSLGRRMHG